MERSLVTSIPLRTANPAADNHIIFVAMKTLRKYQNGGTSPKSATEMFDDLSPALQDFARRRANQEMYYGSGKGSFYDDVMRRRGQFYGMRDRDGNVLPQMFGEEMREILGNREGLSFGEAKMSMMLNRMLQRAMAGDTYAEDFLNRVNDAYDRRMAERRSEAERQARLSKGSGKPGPFER